MHQEWCVDHVMFFGVQNPYPQNRYLNWLYEVGDSIFVTSPELMLNQLGDLFEILSNTVTKNQDLYSILSERNFICWETASDGSLYLVFSWPSSNEFQTIKQRLQQRWSQQNGTAINNALNSLDIVDDVRTLIDNVAGNNLKAKLIKYFNPVGEIKIPLHCFTESDEFKQFMEHCRVTFDYSKLIPRVGNWNAYELIQKVNNSVCPYCNRSFTHAVFDNDIGFGRPEIDHFLPKSIFPFYALSLFNLIPVCHTCNHAKSDTSVINNKSGSMEYSHLHPNIAGDCVEYSDIFCTKDNGDLIEYLMSNVGSLSGRLMLTPEAQVNEKLVNSFLSYNLAAINNDGDLIGYYGYHHKDIEHLLDMVRNYPVQAIDSIANLIETDKKHLQKTFVDVLLVDHPKDEPLGKLKNDMLSGVVESWWG